MSESTTGLPHWNEIPNDVSAATSQIKQALRTRINQGGRSVEEVVADIEADLREECDDIAQTRSSGGEVWPVVEFADIAAGRVSDATNALIRRRGCVVVRSTFDATDAQQWDRDVVEYVDSNQFFENYRGPGDDFFASVESKPEIYPIYWSGPQMEARQHPNMVATQRFLNHQWTYESDGRVWFDPDREICYPDRIRRRPPGTTSKGLGHHLDPGTLDLWMSEGYQNAFRHVFDGDYASYDPWDAAYRVDAAQFPGSTMCSAFRTFQGWTALSSMRRTEGVLHTVPIARAIAYLLLRPLLSDVDDDDLCGVRLNRVFPVNERFHSVLLPAASPIPDVEPGDTVWWHCDLVHSVGPVVDQKGWGNVLYIPAAPGCVKNARYAESVKLAFEAGNSPSDFPDEHYEAAWPNRFQPNQLNEAAREALGYVGSGTSSV